MSQEEPGSGREPIPDDLMLDPDSEEFRNRHRRLFPELYDESDRVGPDEQQTGRSRQAGDA
jgi:hypothetical protein